MSTLPWRQMDAPISTAGRGGIAEFLNYGKGNSLTNKAFSAYYCRVLARSVRVNVLIKLSHGCIALR